jgi:hypothetical protein
MNLRTKLFLAGLGALTLATLDTASAFQIDPQCQKMSNKIACTCALQNGGDLRFWGGQMHWEYSGFAKSEVTKCIRANGGEE